MKTFGPILMAMLLFGCGPDKAELGSFVPLETTQSLKINLPPLVSGWMIGVAPLSEAGTHGDLRRARIILRARNDGPHQIRISFGLHAIDVRRGETKTVYDGEFGRLVDDSTSGSLRIGSDVGTEAEFTFEFEFPGWKGGSEKIRLFAFTRDGL